MSKPPRYCQTCNITLSQKTRQSLCAHCRFSLDSARIREKQNAQLQALRKIAAENKAFDHFVNTGQVLPLPKN